MNEMKNIRSSKEILFLLFLIIICLTQFSCNNSENSQNEKDAKIQKENPEYHVAAYIWPSCHHDERFGDMLWPERTGEWEVIRNMRI